jgi:hypothetical protein
LNQLAEAVIWKRNEVDDVTRIIGHLRISGAHRHPEKAVILQVVNTSHYSCGDHNQAEPSYAIFLKPH